MNSRTVVTEAFARDIIGTIANALDEIKVKGCSTWREHSLRARAFKDLSKAIALMVEAQGK